MRADTVPSKPVARRQQPNPHPLTHTTRGTRLLLRRSIRLHALRARIDLLCAHYSSSHFTLRFVAAVLSSSYDCPDMFSHNQRLEVDAYPIHTPPYWRFYGKGLDDRNEIRFGRLRLGVLLPPALDSPNLVLSRNLQSDALHRSPRRHSTAASHLAQRRRCPNDMMYTISTMDPSCFSYVSTHPVVHSTPPTVRSPGGGHPMACPPILLYQGIPDLRRHVLPAHRRGRRIHDDDGRKVRLSANRNPGGHQVGNGELPRFRVLRVRVPSRCLDEKKKEKKKKNTMITK